MKRKKTLLLTVGCLVLLMLSWLAALTTESDGKKQAKLLLQAEAYMEDEIYVRAIPLLEEAAGYEAQHSAEVETALKDAYLHMMGQGDYSRRYTKLLDKQMGRNNAEPAIFAEAASYYLDNLRYRDAFTVLRKGIEKTGSQELVEQYEENRYVYDIKRGIYEDVTAISNGAIQVRKDGRWGLANVSGNLVIPCEYEKISTFSNGQAIAQQGEVLMGVDENNNRVALCHEKPSDFTNFEDNRLGLLVDGSWVLADGNFNTGGIRLQSLGMYTNGGAAAQTSDRWGVLGTDGETWLIPPEYDGIIQDTLGRCYAQEAVFVQKGDQVLLLKDGKQTGEAYEDARPFADGWAAVKKEGKWGFIDTEANVKIDFQFEDALSFGQHLAAVKKGDRWGFISLEGKLVIEPIFLEARSFSKGSAPVRTGDGWRFIVLKEFEKGAMGL